MTEDAATLDALPDLPAFRKRCQALAMLDSILSPEWQFRHFSYNAQWDEGHEMASMRDGCGSEYYILFNANPADCSRIESAVGKVFCQDSPLSSISELRSLLPDSYQEFLEESAFSTDETTCLIWYVGPEGGSSKGTWHMAPTYDTEIPYMAFLADDDRGRYYISFAEEIHETEIAGDIVKKVMKLQKLSEEDILTLNPEADLDAVWKAGREIGYPV